MTFTPNPGSRYRMPVVLGPAPESRQHPSGRMRTREATGRSTCDGSKVGYRPEAAAPGALPSRGFINGLADLPILQVVGAERACFEASGIGVSTPNTPSSRPEPTAV